MHLCCNDLRRGQEQMQRLYSLTFVGASVVVLAEAGPRPDAWLIRPAPRSMSLSSLEYLLMSAQGSKAISLVCFQAVQLDV